MSSMDIIPIWSQGKAFLQWITGDIEGALRTQVNFSQYCPFVSQACSLVQLSQGNKKGALETQIQFVSGVGDVLNAVPIIGHTKGVIHYVCSDKNGGHRAMKSASRTFVVMTGGAIGFGMGGPAGAAAGGVVGGAVTDGIITSVGSKFHGEYRPAGIFDQAAKLVNNPKDAGQWVDIVGTVAFDALTGYAQGEWMKNESQAKAVAEGKVKREGQQQTETGNMMKTEAEPYTPHDEIPYIEPILLDNNQVEFVSADTVNACVGGASITSIMMAKGEEKQVDKKENKKEDEKQPHDPSSLHIRQASTPASPLDLPSLRSYVIPIVAAKLKRFGISLGVQNSVLEIIKKDHPNKCEAACEEMLKRWLAHDDKTGDRPREWSTIIDALEKTELKEEARELKKKVL